MTALQIASLDHDIVWLVEQVIESQLVLRPRIDRFNEVAQLRRETARTEQVHRVRLRPGHIHRTAATHLVHVQHRDHRLACDCRMRREMHRAEQSLLFRRVEYEQQ